jgi:hypothetical protein
MLSPGFNLFTISGNGPAKAPSLLFLLQNTRPVIPGIGSFRSGKRRTPQGGSHVLVPPAELKHESLGIGVKINTGQFPPALPQR